MKYEKNILLLLFWVILVELETVRYFFNDRVFTFLSIPSDIILLKPTNFSKQEFMENI